MASQQLLSELLALVDDLVDDQVGARATNTEGPAEGPVEGPAETQPQWVEDLWQLQVEGVASDSSAARDGGHGADHGADFEPALRSLVQAALAAKRGTYGVGALLVETKTGRVVCEGHNEVHLDGFHSERHAEMVVISNYENANTRSSATDAADGPRMRDLTLVTSLEPCPMCMTRIIFAGCGKIRYVCEDAIGGMVSRKESLPPIFKQLTDAQQQDWAVAQCPEPLRRAAFHIWDASREALDQKLVDRTKD